MHHPTSVRWILLVSFLLLNVSRGYAQTSAGAIVGSVSDASGAMIPGVEVTATNLGTNQTRQVVTNETGNYRIEPLQAGVYTVSAELPGFRKAVRSDLKVDVDARLRIDFKMEVGAVSEVVEVTGQAPVVQTDSSQVGQVVDERKIVDLPLPGRNFSALAYITPGTFAPRPNSHLATRGQFVAVGMDERTNQFILDGVNNNSSITMEPAARINIDAVGEFKIQTQNYTAQYGRFAGAQVDVITKSGTNDIHGTIFGFTRNDNLDARNFFDPWPFPKKHEYKRHQYGGVVGGPIVRDKLFFFVGYQGQRQLQIRSTTPTIPLPEFWEGDLSRISRVVRDPLTGQPFPNNQIPKSRIHPISVKFRPLWERATLVNSSLIRNAASTIREPENVNTPNIKVNYNLSSSHQMIGSWSMSSINHLEWNVAGNPEIPGFMLCCSVRNQNFSFQDVLTLSATFINEFRGGMARSHRVRVPEDRKKNYAAEFGIHGTGSDYDPQFWAYPRVNVTGYNFLGNSLLEPRVEGNWMITDIISIQRGNHAIKFGGDLFKQFSTGGIFFTPQTGIFNFTGSVTGDAMADFLLGYPDTTQRKIPTAANLPIAMYPSKWSSDWFIQDDWRATSNLTLNLGLRYEAMFPMDEKYDKFSTFDPSLGNGKGGIRLLRENSRQQDAINAFKRLYPNIIFGSSEKYHKTDANNFAPRVGFAWTPGGKTTTAVRGGYGIFYQIDDLCWCGGYNQPPYSITQRFTRADNPTWDNLWPGSGVGAVVLANNLNYDYVNEYYGHWDLGVQQEVPGGVVVDVSYIGKKGSKLLGPRDINQPLVANGPKPYPDFGPIEYVENQGSSIFHGLQSRVERRSEKGLTMLISYAWSKLIDDGGGRRISNTPPRQNAYNLKAERGLGLEDIRHRFSGSFVYNLPFGSSLGGVARALLTGWELSSIVRANTGSPQTPTLAQNISGRGRNADRPNIVGNPKLENPNPRTGWWNRAAFALPAPGTFGNAARGSIIGPGYFGTDAALMKRFVISEEKSFQFRWEMFNVFNQVNFFPSNQLNFDSPTFGTIGIALPSRQMQAGLKFIF